MALPTRLTSLALLLPTVAFAQRPALPLKLLAKPTAPLISAADLMTRLYVFADDSMGGRETGTTGHLKSTEYIAAELKRMRLTPAGDNGTFFQSLPMIRRAFDTTSTITVEGTVLKGGTDFLATVQSGAVGSLNGAQVMYGGAAMDTNDVLTPEVTRGRVVVLMAGPPVPFGQGAAVLQRSPSMQRYVAALTAAAAVVGVVDSIPAAAVMNAVHVREGSVIMRAPPGSTPTTITITGTRRAAEALLGGSLAAMTKGQAGRTIRANVKFIEQDAPARNVVAILPGADPALRNQYVAIGAHSDHVGYAPQGAVDHDSLHLYREAVFAVTGMVSRGQLPTDEQRARTAAIRVNLDSVRALRAARLDSIRNGADDDGSGSMVLLELAEAFATARVKPRRSLLFVWHTAEEKGLLGARWLTEHPPVPRDSIVAQLNMDQVGRGAAIDLPVGSDEFLALVGSRRLSSSLGDLVEEVNQAFPKPFRFDYQFDADGHPENIYCRSDHFHYARWGIPVVFFTTGLHGDYHQVTDEPQYIDYPHMARIGQLVHDVAAQVANADTRPLVDKVKPDPMAACKQ